MVNITVLMFFWWCHHIFWWLNHNVWWWHLLLVVERPFLTVKSLFLLVQSAYFSWSNLSISGGFISILRVSPEAFWVSPEELTWWFWPRKISQEAGDQLPGDHTEIAAALTTPGRLGCPSPSLMGARGTCGAVVGVFFSDRVGIYLGFLGKSDRKISKGNFVWNVGKDLDIADMWFARLVATFVGQISADGVPASPVEKNMAERSHRSHLHRHCWGAAGIEPDLEGPMMVHALCQFSVFLVGGLEHVYFPQ